MELLKHLSLQTLRWGQRTLEGDLMDLAPSQALSGQLL